MTKVMKHRIAQRLSALSGWLDGKSEFFTRFCSTDEGETFTRCDVLNAHLFAAFVLFVMCVAGWLEGGAQ